MKSSIKWIYKAQLGWMAGTALILIYASGANAQFVELSTSYRYVVPGTSVQENPKPVAFNPAPRDEQPAQMDIGLFLSPDPARFVRADRERAAVINQTQTAPAVRPTPEPIRPQLQTVEQTRTQAPAAQTATIAKPKAPDFFGSPVWGRSPDRDKWTKAVLEVVRSNKRTLDRARDLDTFCPGYKRSSTKAQEMCWVIIMSAISKKESDFKPGTSFREPNGEYSVGLLAMSGHQCRNAPTIKALKNSIENLKCGTRHMVKMINQGSCISCNPGGGANWSVLRKPYRYRGMRLGKIGEILGMTKPKFKSVLREVAKFDEKVRLANLAAQAPAVAENSEAPASATDQRVSTGRQ